MKKKRIEEILRYIEQHQSVSTHSLADYFSVSTMTIRRDLLTLENQGKIVRFHGGANIINDSVIEDDFSLRLKIKSEFKGAIGKEAATLLEDSILPNRPSAIYLGSGSTVLYMAKQLQLRSDIQFITDNLHVANYIAPKLVTPLIMIGGAMIAPSMMATGYIAEKYLNELAIDCAFIGSSAIDSDGTLSGYNLMEAGMFSTLIRVAKHIVVLTDHSKLGLRNLVYVSKLNNKFTLITDNLADKQIIENYRALGVNVIIANTEA